LKRTQVFKGLKTPAMGADVTSVKCQGQWLQVGLSVDDLSGLVLTVDDLSAEDAATLKLWLEPIAQAVEAEVLVTDDADGFKTAADQLGLDQQVCKSQVKRNTRALIADLKPLAEQEGDGSLAAIGLDPQPAVADLDRLGQLIAVASRRRRPNWNRYISVSSRPALPSQVRKPGWLIACACCFWIVGTGGLA
jgi:hypothetical protein